MKKVFFSLAVLCSVALVSCGGKNKAEAADSDTVAVEAVEEVAVDTANGDTTAVAEVVEAVEAPAAEAAPAAEEAPAK